MCTHALNHVPIPNITLYYDGGKCFLNLFPISTTTSHDPTVKQASFFLNALTTVVDRMTEDRFIYE